MVGSRIGPKVGSTIEGKNGTYLVKEIIGRGGNGAVYATELIYGGEALPHKNGYVIKFLEVFSKDEHERDKRYKRFFSTNNSLWNDSIYILLAFQKEKKSEYSIMFLIV